MTTDWTIYYGTVTQNDGRSYRWVFHGGDATDAIAAFKTHFNLASIAYAVVRPGVLTADYHSGPRGLTFIRSRGRFLSGEVIETPEAEK